MKDCWVLNSQFTKLYSPFSDQDTSYSVDTAQIIGCLKKKITPHWSSQYVTGLTRWANTASKQQVLPVRWNVRQPTRLRAAPVLPLDVLTPDLVLPFFPQPFESLSWKPGGNLKCQLVEKKKEKKTHLNVELSFEMIHCRLETRLAWGHEGNIFSASRLSSKWFLWFRRILPAAPGLPRLSCWYPDETANRGQHSTSTSPAQTHVHYARREPRGDVPSSTSGLSPPPFSFQIPQIAQIYVCCDSFLYTHTNTIMTQNWLIQTPQWKDKWYGRPGFSTTCYAGPSIRDSWRSLVSNNSVGAAIFKQGPCQSCNTHPSGLLVKAQQPEQHPGISSNLCMQSSNRSVKEQSEANLESYSCAVLDFMWGFVRAAILCSNSSISSFHLWFNVDFQGGRCV